MEGETSSKIEKIEIETSEEFTEELIPEGGENVTEVDVSYEEINYENDPLVQLLQSFPNGFPVTLHDHFRGFNFNTYKHYSCCYQNLVPVASPLASLENSSYTCSSRSTSRSVVQRKDLSATFLLEKSARGKQIIEEYNCTKILTKSQRRAITHIVIDEFKDAFGKLTHDELLARASELSSLFPSESKDSWYQPTLIFYGSKKTKIGRHPKGTLCDRNYNYRKNTTHEFVKQATSDNITSTTLFSNADWVEYQQTKIWIRHHEDEWPAILQKWNATNEYRNLEIFKLEKRSFDVILQLYPTLRKPEGYQLVQIDFDVKFASKSLALFDKWSKFIFHLKPTLTADVTDKSGKAILFCWSLS